MFGKAKKLDSPEALLLKEEKEKLTALKAEMNKFSDEKEIELNKKLRLIGNVVHDEVVDSNDEANNKVMSHWWPEGRSEADEKKRQGELVKDGKGSPGLYAHNEILERIGGYDPVRGNQVICCGG